MTFVKTGMVIDGRCPKCGGHEVMLTKTKVVKPGNENPRKRIAQPGIEVVDHSRREYRCLTCKTRFEHRHIVSTLTAAKEPNQ